MSALVLRSLPLHNKVTPLYLRRTRRHLTNFTTSNQMSNSSIMQPKFSEGQDEAKVMEETRALIKNGWDLDDDGMGIRKTYHFKNYTKALDLVSQIGVRSKSKSHHSVMVVQIGSVEVYWTTHHPRGLSEKDTFMARYCDERAQEIGAVDKSDAQKCGPIPSSQI